MVEVLAFAEVDRTQVDVVGGKGANLGELSRVEGVHVPDGFCVTTDAFERVVSEDPAVGARLERLDELHPEDGDAIGDLCAEIRRAIEARPVPPDLAEAIVGELGRLGPGGVAVRSSATAEDLPNASFAGQQDSFLNVVGPDAVLEHVRRCWASLFTERAVRYRARLGIDHRSVRMAVVVQRMVAPVASGVMFTADPITSNRTLASVEATFGLGEAIVSGHVNADVYTVRAGTIVTRAIGAKQLVIRASPGGGTHRDPTDPDLPVRPALTDSQVLRLVELGRQIESHFAFPQDIEWCLTDDERFEIVQSRPITTLFPVPAAGDDRNHVYLSVGHQQMMTDAMKPLGLSVWQLTALRPMFVAGGRLFVDVTDALASQTARDGLLAMMAKSDPLMSDALHTLLDRSDLVPPPSDDASAGPSPGGPAAGGTPALIDANPAIVAELIDRNAASVAALRRDIRSRAGSDLFDFIAEDLSELRRLLFEPRSHEVVMAGIESTWWINDRMQQWLGEKNAADALTQSVAGNVTSEMGLALLDVADVIRPHPHLVKFLERVADDDFLDELAALDGGREAHDAILSYLDRYGMRCVGEIDITRPRWAEHPATLVPVLLGNIANFEAGERARRFEQGRIDAQRQERELLERVRALPDGAAKAHETKQMIDRVRTFIGYREYPKYGMISRYFEYKRALLAEAERLVDAGVFRTPSDSYFLSFQEFHEVARTGVVDQELLARRRDEFRSFETLSPPRVMTSEGECLVGAYRRDDLPAGAIAGLAVSAGTVEGRARVVLDMAEADLRSGDILVTPFTDPSWTPLFVTIAGLVTEVGGQMTHGAVIAREYGLPAVVGVPGATTLIRDGQRIRVHGTEGFVELLA